MSENTSTNGKESSQADEIPLDDIDALLDQEDPQFREELSQVQEVRTEVELDEDGSLGELSDDELSGDEDSDTKPKSKFRKFLFKTKTSLFLRVQRFKFFFTDLFVKLWVFLKTRPKEWILFGLSQVKALVSAFKSVIGRFKALPRMQKGVVFLAIFLSLGLGTLTFKNLKGVWIPSLNPPIIYSFSQVANKAFNYSGKEFEMFYKAFPRDPDLFLFEKFKVNLMRTQEHPNPMGAFEVVIELDSKDAAVEVQARQIEFHDLIQREFETQTYTSMLTDLGKQELKNKIKKRIDSELSQGWIEDVHFQTFILKP